MCLSFQIKAAEIQVTVRKFYFQKMNTFRYTATDQIVLCASNADIKTLTLLLCHYAEKTVTHQISH